MQSYAWRALLGHIPPEKQDQFSIVTLAGIEICLNSILRLEHEFVVVKGRLAGSQDGGRIFFIPFATIDHFSFTQPTRETDFTDIFSGLEIPAPAEELPPPPRNGDSNLGIEPRPAIRSEVLERFRARPGSSTNLSQFRPKGDRRE